MANDARVPALEALAFDAFYENLDRYQIDAGVEIPISTKSAILRRLAQKPVGTVSLSNIYFVLDADHREWDLYLPKDSMIMALSVCSRLQTLSLSVSLNEEELSLVASSLGNLRHLTLKRLEALHDGSSLCRVFAMCRTTLHTLKVHESTRLAFHALRDSPLTFDLPALTVLELTSCPIIDKALTQLLHCAPNLETLHLERCTHVTAVALQAALVCCPRLRVFAARHLPVEHALIFSSGATPNLRSLNLEGLSQMPDIGIDTTHRPLALEDLNLVAACRLPEGAYRMLALCCSTLRTLSVSNIAEQKEEALRSIVATAYQSLESYHSYAQRDPIDLLATAPNLTALDVGNRTLVFPNEVTPFVALKKLRISGHDFDPVGEIHVRVKIQHTAHTMLAAATLRRLRVRIRGSLPPLPVLEAATLTIDRPIEDIYLHLPSISTLSIEGSETPTLHILVLHARLLRHLSVTRQLPVITIRSSSFPTVEISGYTARTESPVKVPAECPLRLLQLQDCSLTEASLAAVCAVHGASVVKILKAASIQTAKVEDSRTTLLPLRLRVDSALDLAFQSDHLTAVEVMTTTSLRRLDLSGCRKLQMLRFPEKPPQVCYGSIRSLSLRRCEVIAPAALLKCLDNLQQLVELDLFDVQSLNSSTAIKPLLAHRTLRRLAFLDVGRLRMLTKDDLRQLFVLPSIRKLGLHGLIGARYHDAVGEEMRLAWKAAHPGLLDLDLECSPAVSSIPLRSRLFCRYYAQLTMAHRTPEAAFSVTAAAFHWSRRQRELDRWGAFNLTNWERTPKFSTETSMEHFFAGQLQDLLPLVLTLLPSRDLLGVRLVCKAWCRKIDLLPDSFWNNLFVTEMFQSWITTNGYFTFPYEEFDLLQQAVPLILLNPAKVKLEALTPKQRVCYMQRKPLFTGRSTVLVDFKMEGTQGYFDAHWIFIRKPEGLEWAGPSLAMPIVLTTEEEAQMERVLFGLRHCFKAPFASSATVAVVCTDKESGAVLFEHKHTYGHFLDNLVAESAHYPFDPKKFLVNFVKMEDHCRATFPEEAAMPTWLAKP